MSDFPNQPLPVREESSTDDLLRTILRQAGHRPPVPAEDAAIVKAAALAEWRRTARAEKQRARFMKVGSGILVAAAVLLLALNLGLWERFRPTDGEAIAVLETVIGPIHRLDENKTPSLLPSGTSLAAGTTVETGSDEQASRAVLRLADGQTVRLDVETRLRLLSPSVFELERGAVYVDSESRGAITIQTILGLARDIGTRFEVRLAEAEDTLWVRVREGSVVFEREGKSHVAEAGVELAVDAGGKIVQGPIPVHGTLWDWTLEALPLFSVEDRPLRAFLAWAASEGGWELRFADPDLEQAVAEVILHGSIDGLSLKDAIDLALLSSGLELEANIEGGELTIRRTQTSNARPGRSA